jgi:hypothetical protein
VVELINKPSLQTEDIEEFKRVSAELLSAKKMYKDSLLINWPNFVREIVSEKKPMIAGFNESTLIDQQRLHHELAHTFIGLCMGLMDGFFHVTRPGRLLNENLLDLVNPEIKGEGFDPKFVSFEYTRGVKEDILRDSNNDNIRFVYTAASQFNGAEAKDRYLNAPGAAVEGYNLDYTQGPQAQLAFSPEQVEAINVAAHIGWNGLCDVLDDDTKRTLNFGYFTPNSTEFNRICQQLVENGSFIQYPVVTSTPTGGKSPVTMVLVAAPAFGIYVLKPCLDDEQRKLIEFLCAFNAFRAQLNTCFDIAKAKMVGKSQKIVLKVAAVGLGVFENNPDVVAKALYQALLIFSPRFESNNIEVRFQVFRNTNRADPNAQKVVHLLGLKECQPSF